MTIPANDLRAAIVAIPGLGFTIGTNIFPGSVQPVSDHIPVECLFLRGVAGSEPMRVMTEAFEHRNAVVQLTLRWSRYTTGRNKMLAIMDGLIGVTPNGYLDTYVMQSEPTHSGPTEEGHHIFNCMYMMRYAQSAA